MKGYLNSSKGVVRIYPNQNGVIAHCFIHQGKKVRKGESLFLIDTLYKGMESKSPHDMLTQLQKRKALITDEIMYKKNQLSALKKLLKNRYISLTEYHQKYEEWVELKNKKNSVDMEIIKYQQEKSYIIRSPIDGVISSIIYQDGQYTNLQKPLAKILPSDAELVAELFIPVKQSGFLRKKNTIIIRYDAYPYERFGTAKAKITEISQSILTDKEEDNPITIGQPYYKVIALLDRQFMTIYGEKKKIQHGMTISAVVVGSKRKLWQWILDPLFSFYGDLLV